MLKASSLLYAVAFAVASVPAFGGPPQAPFSDMSDDLFRSAAIGAVAGKSSGSTLRPSFTTNDANRITMAGRFPLGNDFRNVKIPVGDDWSLGWTNDQYGRSIGFSHPIGKAGIVRFGIIRENISNVPHHNAAGMSVSLSW